MYYMCQYLFIFIHLHCEYNFQSYVFEWRKSAGRWSRREGGTKYVYTALDREMFNINSI